MYRRQLYAVISTAQWPRLSLTPAEVSVTGKAADHKPNEIKSVKLQESQLRDKLKADGFSEAECKRNPELQAIVALLQKLSMAQAQSKNGSKGKSRKSGGGSGCQEVFVFSMKKFGDVGSSPPRASTPSTEEGDDSESESDPSTKDEVSGGAVGGSTHTDTRSKKGNRNRKTDVELDGEPQISTRSMVINGLTQEKEAQVQVRAEGKRVVASYRRNGERKKGKEMSSRREFKAHQQKQESTKSYF